MTEKIKIVAISGQKMSFDYHIRLFSKSGGDWKLTWLCLSSHPGVYWTPTPQFGTRPAEIMNISLHFLGRVR